MNVQSLNAGKDRSDEKLRVLHLEDDPNDSELIRRALKRKWSNCEIHCATTRQEFEKNLELGSFDVILSDYKIPAFDGVKALALAQAKTPATPFIFFSGTIGEAVAVESLKLGATDYVLKSSPNRLIPALERALHEVVEKGKQRQMELALRESEARFRTLVEQSLIGIYLIQGERFVYANPALTRILGYSMEEIISRPLLDFIALEDRSMVSENVKKRLDGLVPSIRYHLRMLRSDGTIAHVEAHGAVTELGGIRAILGTLMDVTEKKKLEAQILRAQRMESIGTLAGGIAHDLNNILSPILMAVQILQFRAKRTPEETKLLETIQISAERGAGLVQQVLSFARGSEGVLATVPIKHLIADQEKIIKETFPRSIRLETSCQKGLWNVLGNATEIYQVLMNLCVNARDAMPDGGRLKIVAENHLFDQDSAAFNVEAKPGPYTVISVSDTGAGIPPNIIKNVFDPFFTTKGPGKGTGLGLSTTLGIVKSHGGFITVYSEVGSGTCFRVYLPGVVMPEAGSSMDAPAEFPQGNGKLILVVDDEAAIREVTKNILTRNGYRVLTAGDGSEALSIFEGIKTEIAAVVTDMSMPLMDGSSTIRALEASKAAVKILAVSGIADNSQAARAASNGNISFLTKPYSTERLLKILAELTDAEQAGIQAQ